MLTQGTTLPLIGVGACVSIQFGVVQAAKRMFADQNKSRGLSVNGNLSNLQLYSSGALAGIANSVLAGPIEHVRIRLQTQKKGHAIHGPFDCIRQYVLNMAQLTQTGACRRDLQRIPRPPADSSS